MNILVAQETGDALDIFKFVLVFLVIGAIGFIFDDITQHVKCIVYYGGILIGVLCTFKLSCCKILRIDNRLFAKVLLRLSGEVALGDIIPLGIIRHER